MGKQEKLLDKILAGRSDAGISFDGLCSLLKSLGFEVTVRGSHHIFRKEGAGDKINLQKEGNNAKPYQVKQVRELLKELSLMEDE
jgi:predicted RNA binding protein YcfA (HicA-like mRNA interferase family)